jgi:hypothetical protein
MPEGQFSGERSRYVYESDGGVNFILTLDDTLVIAGSGLVPFDPQNPPAGGVCPAPKRFKPRGVYWQATDTGFEGKRKFIVAGTSAAAIYATNASTSFQVDSVDGLTTGRRGETLTF